MRWFICEVTDPAGDKSESGSVYARINGHQDQVSDKELRLMKPMFPVNNPINNKVGGPVTGLQKGSRCIGVFLDGPGEQIPMLIGTIGSEAKKGSKDGKPDYTKGDSPVVGKTDGNTTTGGRDVRLKSGPDPLDGNTATLDDKSIIKYAKIEAKNPTNNDNFPDVDVPSSFSIAENNTGLTDA